MANFSITIKGLDEFKDDLQKAPGEVKKQVRWAMIQSVNTVKNSAQQFAPYKTGTLRRSIFTDVQESGFRGIIGQDNSIAPYGEGIEFGTSPHDIYPKFKKALFWKGAPNPFRHVHHPGTKPHPFMEPAMESSLSAIQAYFDEALLRVVQFLGNK